MTSSIKFADGQISEIRKNDGSEYQISYYPGSQSYLVKQINTPLNDFEYYYDDNNQLTKVICNNTYQVDYSYNNSSRIKEIRIGSR